MSQAAPPRVPSPVLARLLVVAIGLAILLRLPALFVEFHHDDVSILYYLQGRPSMITPHHRLDLYRWFDGDVRSAEARMATGAIPWHTDDKQKIGHFRPVASALMNLDFHLFGTSPFWPHVHSLLWLVIVVLAAALVYQLALPPPQSAIALLLFSVAPFMSAGVEWWCARYALIAAAFGFLGLWAHIRWRELGWRLGFVVSPLAFAVALLSSESAVQCFAYLFAYALLSDRSSLRSRGASLVAPTGLLAIYLVVRAGLGYGVARVTIYVDPFDAPVAFLDNALRMVPKIANEMLVSWIPHSADLRWFRWFAVAASAAAFVWLVRSALSARRQPARAVHWLLLGAIVSFIPCFACTAIRWQTLFMPYFGLAAAVAVGLHNAWAIVRGRTDATPWGRAVTAVVGTVLLAATIVAPALFGAVILAQSANITDREQPMACDVALDPTVKTLVVLRASDFRRVGTYMRSSETADIGAALTLSLSSSSESCTVTRTGPASLVLEAAGGALMPAYDVWRARGFPLENRERALDTVRIRVLEMNGGAVKRAEFQFDRAVDDPTFAFCTLSGSTLSLLQLPPVGQDLELH